MNDILITNKSRGVASGGDMTVNGDIVFESGNEQKTYGIIGDIFTHLQEPSSDEDEGNSNTISSKDFSGIDKKSQLNFSANNLDEFKRFYTDNFNLITLIQKFLSNNANNSEFKILALIDRIKIAFREIKNSPRSDAPLTEFKVLDQIAKKIVPKEYQESSEHLLSGKAIATYLFELCHYGKRTKEEMEKLQQTLF